jgi:hypothetical protein
MTSYNLILSILLETHIHSREYELLVSIKLNHPNRPILFVTKTGKVFQGSLRAIKTQLSVSIRQSIWSDYLNQVDKGLLVTDEPTLGSTLAVQRTFLEQDPSINFNTRLEETLHTWMSATQVTPS